MFSKRTFSIVPAIADDNAQRAQLLRPDGKTVHNAAILKHDAGNTEATHLVIPYRAAPHSDITPAEQTKLVEFMSPRDGDRITVANLRTVPYLYGLSNVQKVQLYVDDRLVQEMTSYPYEYTLTGVNNGEHALKYKVYDTDGGVTESNVIKIDKQVSALRSLYTAEKPQIDGNFADWDNAAAGFRMDQSSQVKNIESSFAGRWSPQMLQAAVTDSRLDSLSPLESYNNFAL